MLGRAAKVELYRASFTLSPVVVLSIPALSGLGTHGKQGLRQEVLGRCSYP